ncbi:FAD-dependent thymidylate synthase [Helicobacter didelphidarum]|uniref:Flavin-dependent thymidylate synthase n=1 Tax=Helicobacter didelphidarum TaxID=2040648 RepID=A0A3D8IDL2_9HELI|nr:FAD-dependent thymidylate synthase [Helicobacter didelphidarum]RDU63115.1 FAD-dependent thymidylate synthase [Helicobacter didelphidarum]
MQIHLLHYTPLSVCSRAIRTCWDSHAKSDCGGEIDKELIYRVGNKNKHKSTLEHLFYNFEIIGISRACLQELARHRMASLSVKSTRYTLKELRKEESFLPDNSQDSLHCSQELLGRAAKYIVITKNTRVNIANLQALENLRLVLSEGNPNDEAKYCLPECYKTQLVWSVNARSLQNFLELRTSKNALFEIRKLASSIFHSLPNDHKYLFEEFINDNDIAD